MLSVTGSRLCAFQVGRGTITCKLHHSKSDSGSPTPVSPFCTSQVSNVPFQQPLKSRKELFLAWQWFAHLSNAPGPLFAASELPSHIMQSYTEPFPSNLHGCSHTQCFFSSPLITFIILKNYPNFVSLRRSTSVLNFSLELKYPSLMFILVSLFIIFIGS